LPSESLFYYDVASGLDFDYYNNTESYTPVFAIQPTDEQRQVAERVCTVDGVFSQSCAYDYYATGNELASRDTATSSTSYFAAQTRLGLLITLLSTRY